MTHAEVVEKAAAWLRRKCPVVVTEISSSPEQPDVIGWKSWLPILIECKASRSDFIADSKKWFRHQPKLGLGRERYYMAPEGIIKTEEVPENWGLLEIKGQRVYNIVKPKPFAEYNRKSEVGILLSLLQRIGQTAPQGVSIRCYNFETKNTATLGIKSELDGSK